jgi:hypothetical protein
MPVIKSADLKVNQPIEVVQPDDPANKDTMLTIDVDPAKKMPVGTYSFRLVVTDKSNNESAPFDFLLTIADEGKPVAIITGQPKVAVGKGFTLNGEKSSDPEGGKLAKFRWTLIQTP